jgi:hypothetical protein
LVPLEDNGNLVEAPTVGNKEDSPGSVQDPASSGSASIDALPNAKAPRTDDSPALFDLNRALVEAAEEMTFDWPEFLPVERIIPAMTDLALGFLVFTALIALDILFLSLTS